MALISSPPFNQLVVRSGVQGKAGVCKRVWRIIPQQLATE